jgi:hypothetical protein
VPEGPAAVNEAFERLRDVVPEIPEPPIFVSFLDDFCKF